MKLPAVPLFVLVAAAACVALWAITRQGAASAAGSAAAQAAIDAAGGAISGTVIGLGKAVGVPETNNDQCTLDLAAGRLWDASFSCPAPRYLKALASGDYGSSTVADAGGATGTW